MKKVFRLRTREITHYSRDGKIKKNIKSEEIVFFELRGIHPLIVGKEVDMINFLKLNGYKLIIILEHAIKVIDIFYEMI